MGKKENISFLITVKHNNPAAMHKTGISLIQFRCFLDKDNFKADCLDSPLFIINALVF